MSKEDVIEVEGVVREAMPNTVFKVELLNKEGKPNGHTVLAPVSYTHLRAHETKPNHLALQISALCL